MLEPRRIADRFEVKAAVAAGAMATVHRGWDHATNQQVAIKILRGRLPDQLVRFEREAEILAALSHPAIVRSFAHGVTDRGECWLAMEWLEGEDLAQRLAAAELLSVRDSINCARRVAEALAFAHARGLVHRDVKPSNVFLCGGRIEDAKLVDFGLARALHANVELTESGMLVGTPAFMSPEQARGGKIDAGSDVFSLGAVLYRCLTGHKPFAGNDAISLITEILTRDPAPPSHFAETVSPALDALVLRMLAKEPEDRPADGSAALDEIDRIERPRASTRQSDRPPAVGAREKKLVCALFVRTEWREEDLGELARAHGGTLEWLGRDVAVLPFAGTAAATDLAARAARGAIALRGILPTSPVALATGRALVGGASLPLGELIDRGTRLLRYDDGRVRIDEVTAGLLDARFDVGGDERGLFLLGLRELSESTRTLLGRETPCVGREAELAMLDALYATAIDEPRARAVVVKAAAGFGKSRLRYEFLRRARTRGDGAEVWTGRGDPMAARAPFAMLAEAIRAGVGIASADPLPVRQRKLRARVGRHVAPDEAPRVARFLGEMIGAPFVDDDPQLRAARLDAVLMGDQVRRALEEWLSAECSAHPIMLVLEDLHWGDLPTVNAIDGVLRSLAARPFFVLALARPEVNETFPALWAARDVQEIRLGELPPRASERLVRAVLGPGVEATTVARLVERAAGNAFFLEELLRGVAEGAEDTLPETVLAMLHARIDALLPEQRQLLRAASIFGERFSEDGALALLGKAPRARDALAALAAREILVRRGDRWTFRHALVRDAAYDALTDADRREGHRSAARWLEEHGEREAAVLAEHYERGEEPERAVQWYRLAAEQALGANDWAAVLGRVERGLACGAKDGERGALLLLRAEAHDWRGEFAEAEEASLAAMVLLGDRRDLFYVAVGEAAFAAGVQGHKEVLRALAERLGDLDDVREPRAWAAAARLGEQLIITGERALAERLLAAIERQGDREADYGPAVAARLLSARGLRECFYGSAGEHLRLVEEAIASFERAGDLRNACMKRERGGYARIELGDYAGGAQLLRESLASAEKMGLANVAATARHNMGLALARLGRFDEAEALEIEAAEAFAAAGNRRMEGASYEYLALIRLAAARASEAEEPARRALRIAEERPVLPLNRAESLAILARVELATARVPAALARAREAFAMLEQLGGIDDGEALIRLVYAEALAASGLRDDARVAIAAACARLDARAAKIPDADLRARFLDAIPDHAGTRALSRALGA